MRTLGRSSRLAVVRSSRRRAAVTSLGGPLRPPGRGPELGSLAGHDFLRSIPSGLSALLALRFQPSGLCGGPFLRSRSRALARRFREPGFRTLSGSSFCFEPHLRAAFRFRFVRRLRAALHSCFARCLRTALRFRSIRAWRSPKLPQRVGGASVSQLPGLSHPRTVPECGFPKAPTPFPARISL